MCCIDWGKVVNILSEIVIPLVVAWIAWLAFKVNENKLKLDLYNRRFNVYESALNYYFAKVYGTEQEIKEARQIFTKHIREAGFLFGKDSAAFKTLMQLMQHSGPALDLEKLLLKLEDALEPWLDFRNISRSGAVEE